MLLRPRPPAKPKRHSIVEVGCPVPASRNRWVGVGDQDLPAAGGSAAISFAAGSPPMALCIWGRFRRPTKPGGFPR